MNRKIIIQIAVVVVCLGAAVAVLYNGLFKSSGGRSTPAALQLFGDSASSSPAALLGGLPKDFSAELKGVLVETGLQHNLIEYPKVGPNEVGLPINDLIKPEPLPSS